MSDSDPYPALTDFNEGFMAGFRGAAKAKGRSPTYNTAYTRGIEARKRQELRYDTKAQHTV